MAQHYLGLNNLLGVIVTGPAGAPIKAPALGMTSLEKWLGLRDAVLERHGVAIVDGHPVEIAKSTAASIGALLRASVACRTAMDLDRLKVDWLGASLEEVADLSLAQTSGEVSLSYEVAYTMLCREMLQRIPVRFQAGTSVADALNVTVGAGGQLAGTKTDFLVWHWYRNEAGEFAFHARRCQPSSDLHFMISSFGTGPHSATPTLCKEEEIGKIMTVLEPFWRLSAYRRLALRVALQRDLKAIARS